MEKLPPVIAEGDWAQVYGWTAVRAGKAMSEAKAVSDMTWEFPTLAGIVRSPEGEFRPVLNLRSAAFTENRCACADGRRGKFCAHALALYFSYWSNRFAATEAKVAAQKAAARSAPEKPAQAAPAAGRIGNGRIAIIPAAPAKTPPPTAKAAPASDAIPTEPKSLALAPERGLPLTFRLLLPPAPKL